MAALTSAARTGGLPLGAGAQFLFCTLAGVTMVQLVGTQAATAAGLALFLLGISHGAGDENGGAIRPWSALQIAAYLFVGLALTAFTIAAPLTGIVAFLMLSAWHFATSDAGAGRIVHFATAGLAIGGSALFRPQETAAVLGSLTGSPLPDAVMLVLACGGAIGAGCAMVAIATGVPGRLCAGACLLAAVIFSPVLAVGFIFFVGHAWPIQLRQIESYGPTATLRAVRWRTLAAFSGNLALIGAVLAEWLTLPIAAAVAIGMATPHMLIERVEA